MYRVDKTVFRRKDNRGRTISVSVVYTPQWRKSWFREWEDIGMPTYFNREAWDVIEDNKRNHPEMR